MQPHTQARVDRGPRAERSGGAVRLGTGCGKAPQQLNALICAAHFCIALVRANGGGNADEAVRPARRERVLVETPQRRRLRKAGWVYLASARRSPWRAAACAASSCGSGERSRSARRAAQRAVRDLSGRTCASGAAESARSTRRLAGSASCYGSQPDPEGEKRRRFSLEVFRE